MTPEKHHKLIAYWKQPGTRRDGTEHPASSPVSEALLTEEELAGWTGGDTTGSPVTCPSISLGTAGCCTTGGGLCTYQYQTNGCCGETSCM